MGVGGTLVPVGPDQVADIGLLEQIIRGVNTTAGSQLPVPRAVAASGPAALLGSDGHKMSKSRSNAVPFLATRDELVAALRRLPTGAAVPDALAAVVATLAATFGLEPPPDTDSDALVDWAVASIEAELGSIRDRYRDLLDERAAVESWLTDGAARARNAVATVVIQVLRATP